MIEIYSLLYEMMPFSSPATAQGKTKCISFLCPKRFLKIMVFRFFKKLVEYLHNIGGTQVSCRAVGLPRTL